MAREAAAKGLAKRCTTQHVFLSSQSKANKLFVAAAEVAVCSTSSCDLGCMVV